MISPGLRTTRTFAEDIKVSGWNLWMDIEEAVHLMLLLLIHMAISEPPRSLDRLNQQGRIICASNVPIEIEFVRWNICTVSPAAKITSQVDIQS